MTRIGSVGTGSLNFLSVDADKFEAISAKHWATADRDKQREMSHPRLEMRKYLGTSYDREVVLRPMP